MTHSCCKTLGNEKSHPEAKVSPRMLVILQWIMNKVCKISVNIEMCLGNCWMNSWIILHCQERFFRYHYTTLILRPASHYLHLTYIYNSSPQPSSPPIPFTSPGGCCMPWTISMTLTLVPLSCVSLLPSHLFCMLLCLLWLIPGLKRTNRGEGKLGACVYGRIILYNVSPVRD